MASGTGMLPLLCLELELLTKKEIFNLTPQDENIRRSCKSKITRNFIAGVLASGIAVTAGFGTPYSGQQIFVLLTLTLSKPSCVPNTWFTLFSIAVFLNDEFDIPVSRNYLKSGRFSFAHFFIFAVNHFSFVAVSWKLSDNLRIFLQSGAGAIFGTWILDRSMFSCAEQIFKLDESILQKELAKIVVTEFQRIPEMMQLMSKHFYSERIFDDSTSNNPKLRWRHRNFFSDHDYEDFFSDHDKTQGDCHNDSYNNSQGESENVNDRRRTNLETKYNFIKAGPDTMAELDPLDCLFGYDAPMEEIHHPTTPNKPSGTHKRRYRRIHRRLRMRNYDDLSNS